MSNLLSVDFVLTLTTQQAFSRRHVKNFTKCSKNVIIIELYYYIWNHHGNCIQISTNLMGIGLDIREISFEILRILIKQKQFWLGKTNGRML